MTRKRGNCTTKSNTEISTRPVSGMGRVGKLKNLKNTLKLNNVRGVIFPAVIRLGRLAGNKSLESLLDRKACCLLRTKLLKEVSPSEKINVMNMIHKDLPTLKISKVLKVNNPFLREMYEITKLEYRIRYGKDAEERLLFHSTRQDVVQSIVEDNLDWRRVCRSRFGIGNCFSSSADYANCHANRHNGKNRAFIISKVLVCNKVLGQGGKEVADKTGKFDTATGGKYEEIVFVKFNDNESLPVYVAYYELENDDVSKSKYYRLPNSWFN